MEEYVHHVNELLADLFEQNKAELKLFIKIGLKILILINFLYNRSEIVPCNKLYKHYLVK